MICRSLCAALLCAALPYGTVAWAGSSDALSVRTLAASCAACHGTDGHAVPGGAMPPLAGLKHEYFLQQMQAIAPLMQHIARGFDAAQTAALAAYFERQRAAP
jgi:cytochrome c553